jgi:hypothetical protein
MKINEFVDPKNFHAEEYDLHDDLKFFMNNDPDFYRKHYYPTILKMKICHGRGDEFTSNKFMPIVKEAFKLYKTKFPVKNLNASIKEEDLNEICTKIHDEELKNIESGQYD